MTAMSYKSKLVAYATSGEHYKVRVDSLSARKLIAWVDLLCPYWNEDDIRAMPDPDPNDPFFANSAYPPRTPGVRPFADSPYPPRMKNAPVVDRAFRQDEFPTQAHRLLGTGAKHHAARRSVGRATCPFQGAIHFAPPARSLRINDMARRYRRYQTKS